MRDSAQRSCFGFRPGRRVSSRLAASCELGATCRRLYSASSLRRHEHLDRLALVHRPVAVGYAVEVDDAVEDPARLDPSLEDVGQQFLDVGADRGGTAADADVVVERRLRSGELLLLRDADPADGAAGSGDSDRRQLRLLEADALEYGVDAVAAGQFFDALDGFVAAFAYDIGGSELARERNPVGMAAEEDDLFRSEPSPTTATRLPGATLAATAA